jgi:hypothetical protein
MKSLMKLPVSENLKICINSSIKSIKRVRLQLKLYMHIIRNVENLMPTPNSQYIFLSKRPYFLISKSKQMDRLIITDALRKCNSTALTTMGMAQMQNRLPLD